MKEYLDYAISRVSSYKIDEQLIFKVRLENGKTVINLMLDSKGNTVIK